MSEKGLDIQKIKKEGHVHEEAEKKTDELKCPICGTVNRPDAEQCDLCMTKLAFEEGSSRIKVVGPSDGGDIFSMIDLEDPKTRKQLEELLLIPGVTKRKALYLYRSGITSLEEFVEKAFHGDRHGKNFSRILANKLIMDDLKKSRGGDDDDVIDTVTCISCNTKVNAKDEKCHICGHVLEVEIPEVNITQVSDKLSEVAEAMVEELAGNDDFAALPDEMKAQVASILDSDDLGPDDISTYVEGLGEEFKSIAEEPPEDTDAPSEPEAEPPTGPDEEKASGGPSDETDEEKPAKLSKEERKKKVLLNKIKQWYIKGYDVSGLYGLIDGDLETFKAAAQEMLRKGKREE